MLKHQTLLQDNIIHMNTKCKPRKYWSIHCLIHIPLDFPILDQQLNISLISH